MKHGARARILLLPKIAACFFAVAVIGIAFLIFGTDEEPSAIEAPTVTTTERQRIFTKFNRARSDARGELLKRTAVKLTSKDLGILVNWAFSVVQEGPKAIVEFDEGSITTRLVARLPRFKGHQRYINVVASGNLGYSPDRLDLELSEIRFGEITVPKMLLAFASAATRDALQNSDRTKPILRATELLSVHPEEMTLVYRESAVSNTALARLLEGANVELIALSARSHINNLMSHAKEIASTAKDDAFETALRIAFKHAQNRSVENDPVTENKAAILALNTAIGNESRARFVGSFIDEPAVRALREAIGEVSIRGHQNWTEDFLLAASITVTSSAGMSETAAVFKEELDAKFQGNSGLFSIWDFLARMSGTRFGEFATQDADRALASFKRD